MYAKMADILMDETLYPRNEVHLITVGRYKKALMAGNEFPPVLVGKRDGRYILIDGWHRYRAHLSLGSETILATLTKLPEKQWFMEAVRLNVIHGDPLSRHEKLQAAMRLQRDGFSLEQIQTVVGEEMAVFQKAVAERGHWLNAEDIKPIVLKRAVAQGLATRSEPPTSAELASINAAQSGVGARSCESLVRELLLFLNNDFAPVTDRSIAALDELYSSLGEWLRTHSTTTPQGAE